MCTSSKPSLVRRKNVTLEFSWTFRLLFFNSPPINLSNQYLWPMSFGTECSLFLCTFQNTLRFLEGQHRKFGTFINDTTLLSNKQNTHNIHTYSSTPLHPSFSYHILFVCCPFNESVFLFQLSIIKTINATVYVLF